ncbi:MAG TPA: hypothetical protein VIL86_17735 [Tepidisphaeraceae bacterium]|jgi:hypothetical protein
MPDQMNETATATAAPPVQSPPSADQPAPQDPHAESRRRLHWLAAELIRTQNRKLLIEFLQLRRAVR